MWSTDSHLFPQMPAPRRKERSGLSSHLIVCTCLQMELGCLVGDSSLPRGPLQAGRFCDPLDSIPPRNQLRVSSSPALSGGPRTSDLLLPHLPGGRPGSDKQQNLRVAVPGGRHDPGKGGFPANMSGPCPVGGAVEFPSYKDPPSSCKPRDMD